MNVDIDSKMLGYWENNKGASVFIENSKNIFIA